MQKPMHTPHSCIQREHWHESPALPTTLYFHCKSDCAAPITGSDTDTISLHMRTVISALRTWLETAISKGRYFKAYTHNTHTSTTYTYSLSHNLSLSFFLSLSLSLPLSLTHTHTHTHTHILPESCLSLSMCVWVCVCV